MLEAHGDLCADCGATVFASKSECQALNFMVAGQPGGLREARKGGMPGGSDRTGSDVVAGTAFCHCALDGVREASNLLD